MKYGPEITGSLPSRPAPGSTAVYWFYAADGELLYIGLCDEPVKRWANHANKSWWPNVSRFKVVWLSSRQEAMTVEEKAIIEERPLHNIALNGIAYRGTLFPRVHLHRLTWERFENRPFTMVDLEEQLGISRGSAASKTRQLVAQGLFESLGKLKGRSGRLSPHYRARPIEGDN